MTGDWLAKRTAIAAKQYDEWPDLFKEAFRLNLVVDRIPPTLEEGVSLLSEIDRLTAQLTSAKEEITRLNEHFDKALAAAEKHMQELTSERKETGRLREKLEASERELAPVLEEMGRLFKLREDLDAIFSIAENAPELNMINYDHDQVAALNTAMVEIWEIVHAQAALQERQGEE